MIQGHLMRLADKYRPLVFLAILFFIGLTAKGQAVYNPSTASFYIVTNKPLGIAQAAPSDGRSMKLDTVNGLFRPYNGVSEVLSYLPLGIPKYRTGNFIIIVDSGGSLQSNGTYIGGVNNFFMFKDGTSNANLVELNLFGSSGCVGCLLAANNLSDLSNAGLARSNLGLGTMATQNIAAAGDLSGNWNNITVAKFNGQLPTYYLNYLNLSNVPAIPPQLNLFTLGLISQSGTYPNITITGNTPTFEQTLLKLNTLSQVDSINAGSFTFRIFGNAALGIPTGTTAQRPSSPAVGDSRYNTDSLFVESWNGSAWKGGAGGGGGGGGGITALTGDGTASGSGSVPFTLATVNTNVFGSNTALKVTVNGKGLITAAVALSAADLKAIQGYTSYDSLNPKGYIPLTALSATAPLAYNNTTGVFSMPAAATAQNGYLTSTDWNTFNGKLNNGLPSGDIFVGNASNIATGQTMTGDIGINNTGVTTIQALAVTTGKINNSAVTYAKFQNATANQVLLGAQTAGAYTQIVLGTNLFMSGDSLYATTAGAQTLTYTQNATTNNLAISGGNSVNFLIASATKAGLIDSAHYHFLDSLYLGLKTFNLFAANGLTAANLDSFYFGGTLNQATVLNVSTFPLSFTNLPNKTSTGTDSLMIEDAAGRIWKAPITTGGLNQLTGDVTAGPGSGSQVATISALAITTGKLAANAVTLGKMSTNVSNSLLGYDGSGNPNNTTVGSGLTLTGGVLTSTGGLASIANFTYLGVSNLTGSSAVPVAINQQVYNVLDYGIKNDSSADISVTLQALIDFVPKGSVIFFPAGRYRQDHGDTITKAITLQGSQPQIIQEYGVVTSPWAATTCGIWHTNANDTAFYVNNNEVTIRNLAIVNSNASFGSAGSRGVYYQHAGNAVMENCSIYFFGIDMEVKNGGQYFFQHNEYIDATGLDEVLLQDSAQNDEGDGFYQYNYNVQLTHNITNQVEYRSGGGIHFNYNKGNALHHATAFFYAPFIGTIITEAIGNGSEQCNGPEFWIKLANSSSTLNILKIQNNYMDGSGLGGHIVVDGSAATIGIQGYDISGNVIAGGVVDTGIVLNNCHFGGVGLNYHWGSLATVVTLGSVLQTNNMGFKFYDEIRTLAEVSNKITMDIGFGNVGYITATGNDTLVLVAPKPGGPDFTVRYTQDATGGHTLLGQGFGENFTGAAGGYDNISVDPRPLKTTYITGHINPNGAATIYKVQRVMEPGAIPFIGNVATNGLTEDSGRFVYDQTNRALKIGLNALAGGFSTTFQDYGAISVQKDSMISKASTSASLWLIGMDTAASLTGTTGPNRYLKILASSITGGGGITPSNTIKQYYNGFGNFATFNTDSIPQGSTNLYFTNALARGAFTLTTTGSSGAATYNSSTGVFNIPQYSGGGTPIGGDQAIQYDSTGVFGGNTAFLLANYASHTESIINATSNANIEGLEFITSTAATVGAPKFSPAASWTTSAWNATTTTAQPVEFLVDAEGQSTATPASAAWTLSAKVNGGAASVIIYAQSNGFLGLGGEKSLASPLDVNLNSTSLGAVLRSSLSGNYCNIVPESSTTVYLGFNSASSNTNGVHFNQAGQLSLGTNIINSRFSMYNAGTTYSLANNALSGVLLNGAGWTYNDNSTAASGTVSQTAISAFGVPTITATNTAVTYTTATTLYVAGAPSASTNMTITNPIAFNVASGLSQFSGPVTVNSNILTLSSSQLAISGASNWNPGSGIGGSKVAILAGPLTDNVTAASGTVSSASVAGISGPFLAAVNTGVAVTNAYTLLLNGPPQASTNVTITNGYSLGVTGPSIFGGNVFTANVMETTTPTIAAGTGAGTSPTISITGSNQSGLITVTTGTAPTLSAVIATITYGGGVPFKTGSYPVLFPANAAAALLSGTSMVFTTGSTTNFTLTAGTVALTGATVYSWYFKVGAN